MYSDIILLYVISTHIPVMYVCNYHCLYGRELHMHACVHAGACVLPGDSSITYTHTYTYIYLYINKTVPVKWPKHIRFAHIYTYMLSDIHICIHTAIHTYICMHVRYTTNTLVSAN